MNFTERNNLYRFIRSSEIGSRAERFDFNDAEVVRDWLSWIQRNDMTLSDEEKRLISCLILAAKLDFDSPKKAKAELADVIGQVN